MNKEQMTSFSLSVYGNVTAYNEVLSQARCRIFYKGANRNGTFITDEFAEKLVSTLPYTPVKGIYDSMEDDFTDHGKQRYEGRIYGIVPENPNFAWEPHVDEDGVERIYACTDVYLFTGIYKQEALQIVDKAQSMELYADSIDGEWQFINGKRYFVFKEGRFLGLQALGDDYEPCFEGAAFYTFCESIKNTIEEFEQFKKALDESQLGGEQMEFKLSDNQKLNMIWTLLNPNFNEEGGWVMDYSVCEVYDEYALVFNYAEGGYERVYYTKDDETDSVALDRKETAYILDVNEEEKRALDMLHSIRNNSFEHVDEYVMGLEDKITESDSKIEECNMTIATLQKENEEAAELYNTIKTEHDNSLVELEKLAQENEQLTSYKAAAELAKKEAILTKYSAQLDNETIDGFRGELDNYTEEGLEKELAFVLVQSKPAIFTTEEKVPNFVPKDDSHNGGIEEILSRYKK
jgi:FtsZ-binding cell division protein ZapB